jgi:hypothetical protein
MVQNKIRQNQDAGQNHGHYTMCSMISCILASGLLRWQRCRRCRASMNRLHVDRTRDAKLGTVVRKNGMLLVNLCGTCKLVETIAQKQVLLLKPKCDNT